jgi:hypothetical protein
MLELDAVRKYLSVLMGKDFRQYEPGRCMVPAERVRWIMQATWARGKQTPYVHTVWAEVDDTLHIESEVLGDTIDVTEWMYGDESLHYRGSMDMSGFDRVEGRSEYAKRFPLVVGRLNAYESYTSKLAEKLDVDMRLLFHGHKGLASFRLDARFGTDRMPFPLILHHIDLNVVALQHTFYEIADRQRTLYFTWGSKRPDIA